MAGWSDEYDDIRAGSTVEFLVYSGRSRMGPEYKPKRGRAVMRGPHGWVINGGGKHGTPHVVSPANFKRTRG